MSAPPRPLFVGEALRHVRLRSNRQDRLSTGVLAGRFVLMLVLRDVEAALPALAALARARNTALPDATHLPIVFCADPAGEAHPALGAYAQRGVVFYDPDRTGLAALGLDSAPHDVAAPALWALFDPTLRVIGFWPWQESEHAIAAAIAWRAPEDHAGVPIHAPVLIVPRVFEQKFCERLIAYYEEKGGQRSGTMLESAEGLTYVAHDETFKRRDDCVISDAALRNECRQRVQHRLVPEIERCFSFRATRMERHIVARYDSRDTGFFKPHRDNTTKGTAHRRFAVTLNLNAGAYEGGDLRFPEFGQRTYRAPTGGAVVFSCSLMHEATPVTAGVRFAYLPFLYDEAGAAIRRANNRYLADNVDAYEES